MNFWLVDKDIWGLFLKILGFGVFKEICEVFERSCLVITGLKWFDIVNMGF